MANKICGVYKIVNIVNNKIYVGSSKDVENRWQQHRNQLQNNQHGNTHLQNAWNMYGSKNFIFEVIEECEPKLQFEREQYYLDTLNPFNDRGYNIVRQISKEYYSDNYIIRKCDMCHNEYHTFSHLSKYCDKCKKLIEESTKDWWKTWVDESITTDDVVSWGYSGWNDFWESNI